MNSKVTAALTFSLQRTCSLQSGSKRDESLQRGPRYGFNCHQLEGEFTDSQHKGFGRMVCFTWSCRFRISGSREKNNVLLSLLLTSLSDFNSMSEHCGEHILLYSRSFMHKVRHKRDFKTASFFRKPQHSTLCYESPCFSDSAKQPVKKLESVSSTGPTTGQVILVETNPPF